jgi:hypothetical protein
MKVLVVGDIHGEDWWKAAVFGAKALHDSFVQEGGVGHHNFRFIRENFHVVFVGDYVDSFSVSTPDMLENLREIVHLAKSFPENVTLLLGNHDIQYIHTKYRCSGFRPEAYFDFRDIFEENKDIFKAAYLHGDILITHAGLTQRMWNTCTKFLNSTELYDWKDPEKDIADHLNFLYEAHFEPLFYAGMARGGMSMTPGIFWADKRELVADPLKGYSQVVGHTVLKKKEMVSLEDGSVLYFIDTMDEQAHEVLNINPHIKVKHKNTRNMKY